MAGVQSPPMHPAAAQGYTSPAAHYLPAAHQQSYQQAAASLRPGTLPPGVGLKIGAYEVTIERFLSEGGFAHVYLVRSTQPISSPTGSSEYQHVLKRVAVPDKETLKEVRWEVDVMKLLRGHKYIVNLIEASAAPIPGTTGYEVFILMEYCSGGGIIDMMNTRLQNRLTEAEILKIFSDVVEAVCWMHTRDPPLMHRDLKVENILLAGPEFYKVCDFGSSTTPKRAPQSMQEIQLLEAELNKHTTLQYRAPEMCDVWSRKEVGLPADIWALGVLLYKLCYYTTPFEEQGPLAILNAQYKIPSYPSYSADMKALIASMLLEPMKMRPTAYQVHHEVCRLRGVPANDSYKKVVDLHQSMSTTSLNGAVSPSFPSRPGTGFDQVLSGQQTSHSAQQMLPTSPEQNGISPMRRGRPNKPLPGAPLSQTNPSALQSEWQIPQQGASTSLTTGEAPQPSTSPSLSGFADSFVPGVLSSPQPAAQAELTGSKTAAAQAAIWEELANPGSTAKAAPTLASLAASRSPQPGQALTSPNVHSSSQTQDKRAYFQQLSQNPTQAPSTAGQDLRRVSPGKPLGPRPNPTSPAASSFTRPTLSPRSTSTATQTDQAESAPSGPPPLKPKPLLVSRASQTSPTLLNQWKQKEQEYIKGQSPSQEQQQDASQQQQPRAPQRQRTSSLRNAFEPSPAGSASGSKSPEDGSQVQRFPSIDDWEASGFTPPPDSKTAEGTRVLSPGQQKQLSINLIGDDTDSGSVSAQVPVQSIDLVASPIPKPSQSLNVNETELKTDDAQSEKSLIKNEPLGNVHGDDRTQESSSDDDIGEPEPATGQHYGKDEAASPRNRTSSNASWSGQVDSQEETSRAPPILAPKPKVGGISSIVSRYENISIAPPIKAGSTGSTSSIQSRAFDKPVKPPKPSYGSMQARQGSGVSAASSKEPGPTEDDFDSRFPNIDEVDAIVSPSSGAGKPSLSGSGGSYSNRNSSGRAALTTSERSRPQSMYNVAPGFRPSPNTSSNPPAKTQDEEDEEYQGVASLRDRWQKKMQNGSDNTSDQSQTNLGRRASTLGNRWNRA